MKSETALQNEIRLELGKLKNIRMFRNNVGMINGVQFGLCVGSSDLIGFQSVTITPEMVGQKIAVFIALEIKTEKGKVSPAQTKFCEMVARFGGKSAIVRSVDDAVKTLVNNLFKMSFQ
jgi:hypothetical protein